MPRPVHPTLRSYDAAGWQYFFAAVVGAAAALTGLLFVAVSINLDRILSAHKYLPARAAETLGTLMMVLLSAALVLVPQSTRLLGVEILVIVVPMIVLSTWDQWAYWHDDLDDPTTWFVSRMVATAMGTVPGAVAGLSLIVRWGGGLYWLVPTVLLGIGGAVYSAWVLLIEIAR